MRLRLGRIIFCAFLIALCVEAKDAGGATWSSAFIDSLVQSWPDNTIENHIEAPTWIPEDSGRMVVVLLGDSHVQGGVLPRGVRMHLAKQWGLNVVPRGYSVPFAVAGTNESAETYSSAQGGWRVNSALRTKTPAPYGPAGIAFETSNRAATMRVRLRPVCGSLMPTKRVEILFTPVKKMCTPLLNGQRPDSMVHDQGVAIYNFKEASEEFTLSFSSDSTDAYAFRLNGFVFDNEASPLLFHAAGLNGADVNVHLRNTFLQTTLQHLKPNIVIISLGTNDAYALHFDPQRFASSLSALARTIRSANPKTYIILTTPGDHLFRRNEENPRLADACEAIRNLAIDLHMGLWDFNRIMGGDGSVHSWYNNGLMAEDRLHFSAVGYELQGKLLGEALYKMLSKKKAD